MPLAKMTDIYPNYKEQIFGGEDIKKYSVYTAESEEKVGEIYDALVDEHGRFRYLVIDTGFWIFGKKVLLPTGRAKIDYDRERIYTIGFTKDQAENLPKYDDDMVVDYDYEEEVRNIYRAPATSKHGYTADTYDYDNEAEMYQVNEGNQQRLRLYEERLIANKDRQKAGEVVFGKKVETDTAKVSVPVEKERVVIESSTPGSAVEVKPGEANFNEGEVARVEVYEESASIEKKAFVREEVTVRTEVERDEVSAQEKVRREELEIDTKGQPVVNNKR
ncbi:MAG: DUF2382 domain-containing protein [Trichodesmium sp. MO_231.B1]|nr:DUF2382 domain-containing protein [Trichodesmium sp. MO_231.B1]